MRVPRMRGLGQLKKESKDFCFWHYREGGSGCMSSSLAHNSPAKDGTHFHMGKLRLVGMTHACTHARTHTHTHTCTELLSVYFREAS